MKMDLYNKAMSFVFGNISLLWAVLFIACLGIESITSSLTTIWFALSAFIMIFLSLTPIPFVVQIVIFTLLSVLFLVFTRPLVIKKLSKRSVTNSDRFIGMKVTTQSELTQQQKSTAKIGDVVWTVKLAQDKNICVPSGTQCIITSIEGNTLIVEPRNEEK